MKRSLFELYMCKISSNQTGLKIGSLVSLRLPRWVHLQNPLFIATLALLGLTNEGYPVNQGDGKMISGGLDLKELTIYFSLLGKRSDLPAEICLLVSSRFCQRAVFL